MKRTLILVVILVLLPWTAVCQDGRTLKLGVIPYKSPRAIVELYSPIASLLTRELGRQVRVVTANDYDQYMERVYDKQYDIIVLGSTFYFKAHDRSGYEVVARGYPSFRCGIITLNTSGIDEIEQLRGKSMAAVNYMDRGGYRLQERALLKHGVNIPDDLNVHFLGKFDSVIHAVLNGQDDAGAIRLDSLQKPPFENIREKIKIIYTSPENPQFPFAVLSSMDPLLREKIAATLESITMDHSETAAILNSLHIQGIERVSSSDLELLRQQRLQEEQGAKGTQ